MGAGRPTPKQEKLAEKLIANAASDHPQSLGAVVQQAGYAVSTAVHRVNHIVDAKGVQDALKARGFTVDAADDVVQTILHKEEAQDKDRLKAADMIYDRLGAKAPEKSLSVAVSMDAKDFAEYEALANKYDEEMRAKLLE